jgi:hypothetical protein
MKAFDVRFALVPLSLAALTAACATAGANSVVSGSIAGLPPQNVLAAASEVCVKQGGSVAKSKSKTVMCAIFGRDVGFSLSNGRSSATLDVMALDGRTPEAELKELRDAVLAILSK